MGGKENGRFICVLYINGSRRLPGPNLILFFETLHELREARGAHIDTYDLKKHPTSRTQHKKYDDDVFYLFLRKQEMRAELHIYLEEGTYHKRLFRGPNTNDMKK